jgi:ketosteroid isomerase-like protein
MSSDNKQTVQKIYDAFSRGDVEAILAGLTDDFNWNVPGGAPFAGARRGKEGMRQFLAQLSELVATERFEVVETLADGDKVVVLGHEKSMVRATGRGYETDFAHVWTLRAGKVSGGQVFADTQAGTAAFAPV